MSDLSTSQTAPENWSALFAIGAASTAVVLVVGYLLLGHRPEPGAGAVVRALPLLNACLNATSAALLTAGWVFIRGRRVTAHKACMISALAVSIAFLVSYVTYHSLAGSRPFAGTGWIRLVYFPLLVSHIVLAAAIVPLALTTVYRALQGNSARHVRIARWTLPIWLYVSVTGVLVYWMLHRL
jgi:putative membrane protein